MITVGIIGAGGRMGMAVMRCAARFPQLRIVAGLERSGHPAVGRDVGTLAGGNPLGVVVTADPSALQVAKVLIEFSLPESVSLTAARVVQSHQAWVLGTTGLEEREIRAVKEAARHAPVLWSPNMSLGVHLLFLLAAKAAAALGPSYDVEILEAHHRHKQDAPSGTALRLAEAVAAARGQTLEAAACYGRRGRVGPRPPGQIGLHAVRGGDIVGEHVVYFAGDGERVELVHRAAHRETFAMGALRAALWLPGRPPGLYDMKDVLGL